MRFVDFCVVFSHLPEAKSIDAIDLQNLFARKAFPFLYLERLENLSAPKYSCMCVRKQLNRKKIVRDMCREEDNTTRESFNY